MEIDPIEREREADRRRYAREERMRARAEAYFNIYYELGAERTLIKLWEYLSAVGVNISQTTLYNYSTRFGWQALIARRDIELSDIKKKDQAEAIKRMETRHTDMAVAMQQVIAGGLKHYLDALKKNKPKKLSIDIISKAAKDAIAIERMARGEPTERRELLIHNDNLWIMTVTQIFISVNDYGNAGTRAEEFASRLQAFVDQRAIELKG